ncbi:MAG TPA: methyltransferase domain-containing protein [Thermoplasmatales archaeon]|nr:methyltransferase domain-containing protein [Thermoplasmatales archaeon]
MQILFELSKEHPTLPIAEIRACLKLYGNFEEIYHNGVFIAKGSVNLNKIAERLAMSFSINEVIGRDEEEFLKNLKLEGTFKIEDGNMEFRRKLGKKIIKKTNAKVDLKNPDVVIRVIENFFCKEIKKINRKQYEERRPSKRPFSMPTTMHPRLARVLVNLSQIKEKQVLLDPFCGTGGILIEAGLIKAKIVGIEIKEELVKACKKNLKFYGIEEYKIYNADMRKMDLEADAIVTDFPYGRASHLSDKMEKLYREAFEKIASWLKKGKKAVIGLPSLKFIDTLEEHFIIEQIHPVRVHKSLTRFFYVCSKP